MWLYFQPSIPTSANQLTGQPDGQYQAGGPTCEPKRLAAVADPIARETKASECAEKREQHRRDQDDLTQQTRAANAGAIVAGLTENQSRIALLSAILSLLTTALLVWTFWETRSASRTELRAYVLPDQVTLFHRLSLPSRQRTKVPNDVTATVFSKNSGQTPATDFVNWVGIDILAADQEDTLLLPERDGAKSVSLISAGSVLTTGATYQGRLTKAQEDGIRNGTLAVFVWGRLSYRDVFRRKRSSLYRMRYSGIWPPAPGTAMTFCDRGNSHT